MATFKSSYPGVGEMLRAAFMQAEMRARAEKVKAQAEVTAPVDDGDFAASFVVSSGVQHHKTARAYGRVTSEDPAALWIELGTSDTPRHRTLGKALGAA